MNDSRGPGGVIELEQVTPDFALSYAMLAPLVSEAYAYLKSGQTEDAMSSLKSARLVIEMASMVGVVCTDDQGSMGDSS